MDFQLTFSRVSEAIFKKCFLASVSILFLSYSSSIGQESDNSYLATVLSNKNGLLNNYVTRVVSDSLNIKWIATRGGLTKYNGKTFTDYVPGDDFPNLWNENIETLFIDRSNNLWIGTKSGGISRLDLVSNTIENYNHLLKPSKSTQLQVMSIAQDKEGNIWVGTWSNGVYIISIDGKFKLIKNIRTSTPVLEVLCDSKGNVWFGDDTMLHQYDSKANKIDTFNVGRVISDILEDQKREKLWVATIGREYTYREGRLTDNYEILDFYDYKAQRIGKINTPGVDSDYGRYLALDKENNLFIGTWGFGLYRSSGDLTNFKKIKLFNNPADAENIIHQTILDIHVDQNNFIWLSMAYGGVIKLTKKSGFFNASQDVAPARLPNDFNIQVIHKNKQGYWIGTSESGLLHGRDLSSLDYIKETIDEKVYSIYQYENMLFVGLEFGVKVFDLNTKKIIMSSPLKKVTSFLIDEENQIWIGTQQIGLITVPLDQFENSDRYEYFNIDNQKIKSNRIGQIAHDPYRKEIWIATYNGMYLWDRRQGKLIRHDEFLKGVLPSIIINNLHFNKDFIWVGTPSGLVKLVQDGERYSIKSKFDKENGLKSDFICSITDDNKGNMWFSTISEIVKIDKSNANFTGFDQINGIETSTFNFRSFYKSETGTLFFGGIDNITFFNPDEIKTYDTYPEITWTDVKVNNESLTPGKILNGEKLESNVEYLDKITLTHRDKSLQIGFAFNDYQGDLNATFRYRLKGLQENWFELNTSDNLNFNSLPTGSYTLQIEGTRNGKTWVKSKELGISVLPSAWLSWWAISIYGAALIGLLLFYITMRSRELRLKRNLEVATIEKEKEAQLTAAKLGFFTNISHEFRTPLTLILGPLEELISKSDQDLDRLTKLEIMQKNANRLLDLINQLLDFRKADKGKLDLKVADGNFVRFAKEVFLYFKEMAKSKDIKYEFVTSADAVNLQFDRGKMEIVLSNLLSNAFKNTPAGGEIILKIVKDSDYLQVSILDSGKGISEVELKKIFDRFYQIKDSSSAKMVGSGIGLSFSKAIVELHKGRIKARNRKAKGAEFTFKLPLETQFDSTQLANARINTELIENYMEIVPGFHKDSDMKANSGETILIVDDNEDIKDYLHKIFLEDYKVVSASDGVEGYQIALEQVPDIIISDVMMPRKDGLEMCKDLKTNIITSHIPIILLTARTASVYEIEGLLNGADAYVTKPFNPNVIKARLKSILDTRIKLRKYYQNKIMFGPNKKEVESEENTDEALLNELITYVEEHLTDSSFGIENLMEKLCVSQPTLYRKLKSLTDLSPSAFIRSIRLKKAAELILTKDYKLSYIAYEVGFNDYKYFKSSFKKQFNCLPSMYRESITSP